MNSLLEAKRVDLLNKSKRSSKGMQRFERRKKSSVANTTASFNSIDMNKLFKDDVLTVKVPVHGETDDYDVTITFGGFLEILRDQLEPGQKVTFREVSRACIIGFNRDDVFISCSCPDFGYRFAYYATRNDFNSGSPETRPSDITNPEDKLGSACKHVLLVLNNSSWILRVSRVIANYIEYMKKHYQKLYADIIYPAIYGTEYEEAVQLTLTDTDELTSDSDTIDIANKERVASTKFQKGNKSGVRFAGNNPEDQLTLTDENSDDVL